jgi:Phage portal protein
MVAEAAASVPWLAYEGREEIDDHPLLALIERPNPTETSVSFIEAICANLLLAGNAYVEQVTLDGAPRELYALRPDRMSIEAGRNGWPAAFVYRTPGGEARYEAVAEGVQTLPAGSYRAPPSSAGGRLVFKDAPPAPGRRLDGVEIDFVVGYGAAANQIPEPLRRAIMVLVAHWRDKRGDVRDDSLPLAVTQLAAPFRRERLT